MVPRDPSAAPRRGRLPRRFIRRIGRPAYLTLWRAPASVALNLTGREFRKIRLRLGLTQETLANRFGIARATLNRWERGRRPVPPIAALAARQLLVEQQGGGRQKPS